MCEKLLPLEIRGFSGYAWFRETVYFTNWLRKRYRFLNVFSQIIHWPWNVLPEKYRKGAGYKKTFQKQTAHVQAHMWAQQGRLLCKASQVCPLRMPCSDLPCVVSHPVYSPPKRRAQDQKKRTCCGGSTVLGRHVTPSVYFWAQEGPLVSMRGTNDMPRLLKETEFWSVAPQDG